MHCRFIHLNEETKYFSLVAAIKKPTNGDGEDMTLPPSFPQTFYALLNKAAKETGLSRSVFAIRAMRFYLAELRGRNSTSAKTLGKVGAEEFAEMSRKVSKKWWATLTPEQKAERAKKAAEGRWGKKKK
jgi:hypothetical protein